MSEHMKVCNVIPSGDCRFNCFLLPTAKQGNSAPQASFPLNVVYDLKIVCPRLDRYWHYEHVTKAKTRQLNRESDKPFLGGTGKDRKRQGREEVDERGGEKGGEGDGLHTRNFEWERRESNFRPEEFGVELGAV